MKKLLFLLLFIPLMSFGQDYGSKTDALKICFKVQLHSSSFLDNSKGYESLEKILSVVGLSSRFVLLSCSNIDNAAAVSYKGIRYIIYDPEFLNSIDNGNNISNLFILAHEIGHHVNGHTLDWTLSDVDEELLSLSNQRREELEADEFAGFVLAKLGYKLEEVSRPLSIIAPVTSRPLSTHPNRTKRLNAVNSGFSKAFNSIIKSEEMISADYKSDEYLYSSIKKHLFNDDDGAYKDYLSFIEKDEDLDGYNKLIKDINSSKYTGRCTATTLKGSQCKRSAKQDLLFCWQHTDNNQSEIVKDRCKALTKSGSQCKRKVSDNKDFCWQHIKQYRAMDADIFIYIFLFLSLIAFAYLILKNPKP